jgi:hypothetical protein
MRLIRDLGRYKSRARLLRDSTGLIPLLLGREPDSSLSRDDEELATVLTAAELAQYTGEGDTPIYLAITGRVYDVSRGRAFYGMLYVCIRYSVSHPPLDAEDNNGL